VNFRRVAYGLDVAPLLADIEAANLWREITARQDFPGSAHHDTECIFLRGPADPVDYQTCTRAMNYPALGILAGGVEPLLCPLLEQIGATELGYALIVRLRPGGHIDEHIDEGAYSDHYSRFHIALAAWPGATLTVGGETRHFRPGSAWWFNHKAKHSGDNRSAAWRIHLIFDAVVKGIQ
jgi:hypothetical protein